MALIRANFQTPPFSDARARQGLALLFDQHELMAAVVGDNMKWETCYGFTVCGGPLSTEVGSEPYRKPDIAKAKALLAEAGYKGEKHGTRNIDLFVAGLQLPCQRITYGLTTARS